jgi:hypothetical protein
LTSNAPPTATNPKTLKHPKSKESEPSMTLVRPSITSDAKILHCNLQSYLSINPKNLISNHIKTQKCSKLQKPEPLMTLVGPSINSDTKILAYILQANPWSNPENFVSTAAIQRPHRQPPSQRSKNVQAAKHHNLR